MKNYGNMAREIRSTPGSMLNDYLSEKVVVDAASAARGGGMLKGVGSHMILIICNVFSKFIVLTSIQIFN